MKQYYITSMYTNGTQIGIQQDHAGKELIKNVLKDQNSEEFGIFMEYINNHKTTVALGVGQPTEILKLYSYMTVHKDVLNIPMGIFQEDSLNKTATCLSFIATEKLCANIHFSVKNMLKEYKIKNLYGLKHLNDELFPIKFVCPISGVSIVTSKRNNDTFTFEVSYNENQIIEMQNNEIMPIDLGDEDVITELYKKYNVEDANYFGDEEIVKLDEESILKEFSYSMEELNLLLMTKYLRLKS